MLKKVQPQLDAQLRRSILLAAPLYRENVNTWIRQAQKMKSFKSKIEPKISKELGRLYELAFSVYYMFGQDVTADEIEELRLMEKKEANFAVWQRVQWDTVGFDAALKRFKAKKIISAADFKAAMAEIKAIAFSVQRVEEANALILLKESIAASINTGATFYDWKKELPSLFENAGYVVTDPNLAPWHLEVVFRTNQASVYSAAKWDAYQDDDYVTGIQYLTVRDNRVRDTHAALDGFIAPKNDPVWTRIMPPNAYNDRCSTSPVSDYYMKNKKLEWSKITDERQIGINSVHEDFTGKKGILELNPKIQKLLDKKYEIIKEI